MSAKLIFTGHILYALKNIRGIVGGFFSSILSFWMHVPMAHGFMVGWFCLTFSPLFNELRDSWSKTAYNLSITKFIGFF